MFATPMYGGQNTEPFFHSAMRTVAELTRVGLAYDWLTEKNESLVHRARMEMTATFLCTKHTHLFWWDADIEAKPEDVAALWNLSMGARAECAGEPADIAVGVYAMKKRDAQWFAAWKDGRLVKDLDQFDGPVDVDYAGTGFMLIRRAAIEAIHARLVAMHERCQAFAERVRALVESEEESAFLSGMLDHFAPTWEGANGPVPALFMTPIHNGGLESEDYHFCRIAREAGYRIVMDPSVRLGHWGQYRYGA